MIATAELDGQQQGNLDDSSVREHLRASIAQTFSYTYPGQSKAGVTVEDIVHRITRLNDIGFVWDVWEEQWKEKYQRLVAFQKEHNSTLIPSHYDADPELGFWVMNQRNFYREFASIDDSEVLKESISRAFNYTSPGESRNGLTVESIASRITRLNAIGFVWDPLGEQWEENYGKLFAYVREFKSAQVPCPYDADPGLGIWVYTVKESYKRQILSKEQIRDLESIGFVWADASSAHQQNKKFVCGDSQVSTTVWKV